MANNSRSMLVLSILLMFLLGTLPLSSALVEVTIDLKYDRNGNLIQDANYYYEYNSYNLLSRIRDHDSGGRVLAEYWYDEVGQRLYKIEYHGDGTNTTTYYLDESLVREIGPDGTVRDTVYYYDDRGTLLAREDHDGKKYFYHPDALGSTALVTDEAGNVVEEVEYLPFGEVIGGGNDRYLFTGKEKDKETGLSYYGARYYDPNQARFIQPDSIQPNVYDPQQLNKYAYARNNPVKYTDPTGHCAELITGSICLLLLKVSFGAAEGYAWGFGSSAYEQFDANSAQGMGFKESVRNIDYRQANRAGIQSAKWGAISGGVFSAADEIAENLPNKQSSIKTPNRLQNSKPNNIFPEGSGITKTLSTTKGDIILNDHTLKQMQARNLGRNDVLNTIEKGESFRYYHESVWKTGYYDSKSKIFVGTYNGISTTAINNVQKNYINNLKSKKP